MHRFEAMRSLPDRSTAKVDQLKLAKLCHPIWRSASALDTMFQHDENEGRGCVGPGTRMVA